MKLDAQRYEIRLARTEEEVASAQRLRYAVFVEEMGAKAAAADHARRLECDAHDPYFDHLILLDREYQPADPLDRVVGVYRLLPGERAAEAGGFYGAAEYDLSPIQCRGRRTLELGRSCIAEPYRRTVAMHLMWNALADYVHARKIEILFGVASFHGTDPRQIADALSFLHHEHLAPEDIRVTARAESRVAMNILPMEKVERREALAQIPNLIKAYLRVGGFVGEGAFVDHDFNTIDVCLLMDTQRMQAKYKSYYSRGLTAA
ncbi:GNAT family N-acetyltransferase [Oceanibium sediminis]|uniref:GNAT family N-acetyltransferase n=1 Tax=Oceanibium sediminis TaxID=2026339 RepID=UPI000DD464CB|nr:GNAT family N-acyltransferase [Oceanibium sediminis]